MSLNDLPLESAPKGPTLFQLQNWKVITLVGKDAKDYLHRISTADFRNINSGSALHTLFLGRDGRMLAECYVVWDCDITFKLIVPVVCHAALLAVIDQYHFTEEIAVESTSESVAVILGPGSLDESMLTGEKALLYPVKFGKLAGALVILPAGSDSDVQLREIASRLTLAIGDRAEFTRLRVFNMLPEFGNEIEAGKTIPLEVGMKSSISFTKGCYPGQEIIARVNNLGHPANMLVMLQVTAKERPPEGMQLTAHGKKIGSLTTTYGPLADGTYLCLGMMKWSFREVGTRLTAVSEGREYVAEVKMNTLDAQQ